MIRALVKFIPNLLSLLNATFGVFALYLLSQGIDNVSVALTVLLLGSMPCDVLDGFAARKLDAKSTLGVDLDSLADVISFAVAPSLMLTKALAYFGSVLAPMALLFVPFSVYRLAKFNHDARQSTGFLGLPTPANALFLCGWSSALVDGNVVMPDWATALIILYFCYLLVSEKPMFGIKAFGQWRAVYKVLLILGTLLSIIWVFVRGYKVLMVIVLVYVVINMCCSFYTHEVAKRNTLNEGTRI